MKWNVFVAIVIVFDNEQVKVRREFTKKWEWHQRQTEGRRLATQFRSALHQFRAPSPHPQ